MGIVRKLKWLYTHPTTKKRPLSVLSGALRWEYHRTTGTMAKLNLGDVKLYARPFDGNGRLISYFGAEFDELYDFMRRYIIPGAIYVDVGANIGSHVLNAARLTGDRDGHVYAFEADPDTFGVLKNNIEINGFRSVDAQNICVTAAQGDVILYLNKDSAKNSIVRGSGTAVHMPGRPLGDLLPKGILIDLLKIDVEGADLDVLRGAQSIFDNSPPPVVVIEAYDVTTGADNSTGITQFLEKYGYSMNQYSRGVLTPIQPGSVTSNAYAVHNKYADLVSSRLRKSAQLRRAQ